MEGRGTHSVQEMPKVARKVINVRDFGAKHLDFGGMCGQRCLFVIENTRHYTLRPVFSRLGALEKIKAFQRLAATLVTFPWYPLVPLGYGLLTGITL